MLSGYGERGEGEATRVTSKWLAAKVKLWTVTFTWKINNISQYLNTDANITSPMFGSGRNRWKLVLHNKSDDGRYWQFMGLSLYFQPLYDVGMKANAMFSVWIVNSKGHKSHVYEQLSALREVETNGSFSQHHFVKRDDIFNELEHLLSEDTLTIMCEVSVLALETNSIHPGDQQPSPRVALTAADASKTHGTVLRESPFSDVTLVVGDQEFPAHRNVLATHSDVFRAMFETNMKESSERRVVIEDLSSETVEDLLQYIYTGKAPNLDTLARELLMAADKYNIKSLKTLCEEQLSLTLGLDNVVDLLVLSKLYSVHQLKKCALHWIARHLLEVKQTEAWQCMMPERNDLMEEILQEVAQFLNNLLTQPPT